MPVSRRVYDCRESEDNFGSSPSLAARIAATPRPHDNDNPLWQGPCGAGPQGGITQSMIVRFLSCRERFRLKYVLGLEPHEKWSHHTGYGNMWHIAEEAHAANDGWQGPLLTHTQSMLRKYPMQQDDIEKWHNVCLIQFPEYVKYWAAHPDVVDRTPLMQEQVFDVPYRLPSGRTVRLRGKFDSVDLIDGGIWLQENKTKSDIEQVQVERQLKFDLQTMLYLIALSDDANGELLGFIGDVVGVRYNVVRRPLGGGWGSIKPREGTQGTKCGQGGRGRFRGGFRDPVSGQILGGGHGGGVVDRDTGYPPCLASPVLAALPIQPAAEGRAFGNVQFLLRTGSSNVYQPAVGVGEFVRSGEVRPQPYRSPFASLAAVGGAQYQVGVLFLRHPAQGRGNLFSTKLIDQLDH